MFKNQLQELAQRSCFNLPAYACIREGPDHAPRFKATVTFNGEVFESPNYCSTLRQAEHAAAEVALNTLSKRGPAQLLASKILDETSICKNLLQENAQRAGVSLPIYTTTRSGPGHQPVFTSAVEVAGITFPGDPAKTKKQAEKNAAMAAWCAFKQWSTQGSSAAQTQEYDGINDIDQTMVLYTLLKAPERETKGSAVMGSKYLLPPPPARINVGGRREVSGQASSASVAQYSLGPLVSCDLPSEAVQSPRHLNHQAYHSHNLPRGHHVGHMHDSPRHRVSPGRQDAIRGHHESAKVVREALVAHQQSPSGARESMVLMGASNGRNNISTRALPACSSPLASHRSRHEISLPFGERQRDEEELLEGDEGSFSTAIDGIRGCDSSDGVLSLVHNPISARAPSQMGASKTWNNCPMSSYTASMVTPIGFHRPSSLAPPVRVRPIMPVHASPSFAPPVRVRLMPVYAAPPRCVVLEDSDSDTKDGEAATRQVLSQLCL